jgi:hypothetical protein
MISETDTEDSSFYKANKNASIYLLICPCTYIMEISFDAEVLFMCHVIHFQLKLLRCPYMK